MPDEYAGRDHDDPEYAECIFAGRCTQDIREQSVQEEGKAIFKTDIYAHDDAQEQNAGKDEATG